jgi:hypothetical protein
MFIDNTIDCTVKAISSETFGVALSGTTVKGLIMLWRVVEGGVLSQLNWPLL